MKVVGTVKVRYVVDLGPDIDNIEDSTMSMEESDAILKEAIEKKYGLAVVDDIFVETME